MSAGQHDGAAGICVEAFQAQRLRSCGKYKVIVIFVILEYSEPTLLTCRQSSGLSVNIVFSSSAPINGLSMEGVGRHLC